MSLVKTRYSSVKIYPQDFRETILWIDVTFFFFKGWSPVTSAVKLTQHFIKRTLYIQGGGSVMFCGCFAASGPGQLT